MTKEDMIAKLNLLPDGTEIWSRHKDGMYPAAIKAFEITRDGQAVAVVEVDIQQLANHRNYVGDYVGTHYKEINLEVNT